MIFKRSFLIALTITLFLTLGFSAGYFAHDRLNHPSSEFPILFQAYEILVNNGLKAPPANPALEYGMIQGMLTKYDDPYTVFVEPAAHEIESDNLQGSFGGIGVSVSRKENGDTLVFPFPDGPASKAGLRDGDNLVQIDDLKVTADVPVDAIQAALRGPVGEPVKLSVTRPPDPSALEFQVVRAIIDLPSVTWHIYPSEPKLGILEINILSATTPAEVQKAVTDLQASGATWFLLDLRDDGGGLLNSGIDTARLFLKQGTIIEQQYRGKDPETFKVETPGPLSDLPLAVLVNHGTASAAEILAGSLQANRRAFLTGSPTYGKDTIQYIFDLKDGSSLHVTSGKWWIPGLKKPIHGQGLQPDIKLTDEQANSDQAILSALQILIRSSPFNPYPSQTPTNNLESPVALAGFD